MSKEFDLWRKRTYSSRRDRLWNKRERSEEKRYSQNTAFFIYFGLISIITTKKGRLVMKVLIVTYELKNKEKDYTAFYGVLKSMSSWAHHIENLWLVQTNDSPENLFNKLRPFMDEQKDFVFITEFNGSYYGWLPTDAWDWVKQALNAR